MQLKFNQITKDEEKQDVFGALAKQILFTVVATAKDDAAMLGNLIALVQLVLRMYRNSLELSEEQEDRLKFIIAETLKVKNE
jgi:hypothetical protein